MKHARRDDEGMALMLTVFALIVILGAVTVVTYRTHTAKRLTDFSIVSAELDEACRAGIDIGVERIWNQYVIGSGNTTGNLASYRVFIDNLLQHNEDTNLNGRQDDGETDLNGNGTFDVNEPWWIVSGDDQPITLTSGGRITQLSIDRRDDTTGTTLTIRCTAEKAGTTRSAVQTTRVAGGLFKGFEFAVLANNINCILCHADIQSLSLARNTDPARYGTFDRIKVGCLEDLLVRSDTNYIGAHTKVAGSVYTRGTVHNENLMAHTPSSLAATLFYGYNFDAANGKILQNPSTGAMTTSSFVPAVDSGNGLEQFANFYMDYPEDESQMTDGEMPTSFPSPFPDEDGDRAVSDTEFAPFAEPAFSNGAITGGVTYGVPSGSVYDGGNSLPAASNTTVAGSYDGNLILVGTTDNPIVINDTVTVNGDVVIQGRVKGTGRLYVRGNAYVTGDVTYADASGQFGVAADGTKNLFALTSGGSIMLGDYLTRMGKSTNLYVDVRNATKNKSTKVGKTYVTKDVGYFAADVVDPGGSAVSAQGYTEHDMSFTTSEITQFNRMEHLKADADPTYVPRYYRIRDSMPIYEYWGQDQESTGHTLVYNNPYVDVIEGADLADATIHTLDPAGNWLTEDQLRHFWYTDEMTRPSSGRPFQFDGLLYTNNAIFCIARSTGWHNSYTKGQMTLRGGIVCADLGMLIPGQTMTAVPRQALKLFYDPRVNSLLRVEDTTQVEFARQVFQFVSPSGDAS